VGIIWPALTEANNNDHADRGASHRDNRLMLVVALIVIGVAVVAVAGWVLIPPMD
jgi:hypothetical protein